MTTFRADSETSASLSGSTNVFAAQNGTTDREDDAAANNGHVVWKEQASPWILVQHSQEQVREVSDEQEMSDFWSEWVKFMRNLIVLIWNYKFYARRSFDWKFCVRQLFEYFLTFLNFSQGGWALQIPQLLGLSHLRWFGRRGAQDSRLRINPTRHRMGEQSNFQQGKKNKKKSHQITLVRSLIDWLIDFRTAPTSVTRSANTRENRGRWVDESCRASVILNRRIFLCPPKSIDRWNVLDEKCFLNEILFFYLFFRFGFLIIPRKSPLRISSGVDPNLTRRVAGLNFA